MRGRVAELEREVEARRRELVERASALGVSLTAVFERRERARRAQVGGILAALAAGILVGVLRPSRHRGKGAPAGAGLIGGVAAALAPSLVPLLVPLLRPIVESLGTRGDAGRGEKQGESTL